MSTSLRIAFFGTPDLTLTLLNEMEKEGLIPALIITGRDVRKGRHMEVSEPAPKKWAAVRDIPVLQPEKIDETFMADFQKYSITLGVVAAYGKILPESLLTLPSFGMINVHYSLLPKYRGATPVESAILAGEKETGVSIQKMAFKLDSGDVVAESKTAIGENETAQALRERLNEIAKTLLISTIKEIVGGTAKYHKQDDALATRCGKINKEDGLIDLNADGIENYRKFKAYFGWPGTYFFTEKSSKKIRVIIKSAEWRDGEFKILRVVPEGKKEMSYEEFVKTL